MGQVYGNYLSRIDKLRKGFEHLIEENARLAKANNKLRDAFETFELREQARERVIKSLSEEDKKQVREENRTTTTES